MKTLNESVLDYLDEFLNSQGKGDNWTSIDWLQVELNESSVSPNPVMNNGVVNKDVLGNEYKTQAYTYSLVFNYTEDIIKMLSNGELLEDLSYYIKDKNKKKEYPELSRGRIATGFSISQTPFLSQIESDNQLGIYVVILELAYIEPRD